jgi:hypothetical protein
MEAYKRLVLKGTIQLLVLYSFFFLWGGLELFRVQLELQVFNRGILSNLLIVNHPSTR